MDFNDPESRALLALMLTPGLGQTLIGRCVEAFGSAEATLGASGQHLGGIKGISAKRASEFKRKIDQVADNGAVDSELEAVQQAGVRLIYRDHEDYPQLLKLIPDPPLLLWVRGELRDDDTLALGVVGARKCSHYGREQADRFAAQCASAGLTIVSGGAYGIDIAAHRAVMRVKGRTVAVIGSGLGVPYPKDHVPVFDQIVGEGLGAVVSEFPISVGPKPENFPRRNRIISGMAMGVLVIEAAKRSGALITARLCVEDHGRECMALPGRVDAPGSAGCHQIIRDGWATLVTSATDVLDQLGDAGQLLKAELSEETSPIPSQADEASGGTSSGGGGDSLFNATLTESQKKLVEALGDGRSLDQLVAWMGVAVGGVQADLTMLEIRGVIERRGGLFVRRRAGG